jgi:hypothetical protein
MTGLGQQAEIDGLIKNEFIGVMTEHLLVVGLRV